MNFCRLCGPTENPIRESHLIPAAVYEHVSPKGGQKIQITEKEAFNSTKQFKQRLLCTDCEDLFSKHGEKFMGKLWATEKGFPLLQKVLSAKPLEPDFYSGNDLSKSDYDAIFYFAISVLWRAHAWPINLNGVKNKLGKKYERQIEDYLLRKRQFKPENIKLRVWLNTNSRGDTHAAANGLFTLPAIANGTSKGTYQFIVLGIFFHVLIGKDASKDVDEYFDYVNSDMIISVRDFEDMGWMQDLSRKLEDDISIRGKLATRT